MAPPIPWTVLLGMAAVCGIGWRVLGLRPLIGQVLCSLGILPLWVMSTLVWNVWTVLLCVLSLLLFAQQWRLVEQRRIAILFALLGIVEGARLLIAAGWYTWPLASGLVAYGWVGAGAWSGCQDRKAVGYGGLVLFLAMGFRLSIGVFSDSLTWVERAEWGLAVEPKAIEHPGEALDLLAQGHQSPDLVVRLLQDYSVSDLMEVGLRPSANELNSVQLIEAARWLELNGRGGEALRALEQDTADPYVCWWATLFARTQGVESPECMAEPDSAALQVSSSQSIEWGGTEVSSQMEIDLSVPVRKIWILTKRRDVSMRFDHGEVLEWNEVTGGIEVDGPVAGGPHRIQLNWNGNPPDSLSLSVE